MADLPVESNPLAGPQLPGSDFIKGALGMPLVRQMTLLVAIAASVAFALFAVNWMQDPEYRPISGTLSPAATRDVITSLETGNVPYKLDQNTGMVLVPAEQVYSARMLLAGNELLDGQQLGYELLDQDQGFGVSQFMEVARHRRSVEGELARSIATITSVSQARVLLATPKTTTFLRDRRRPSASVTVTLKPGRQLTADQVRGITNLVAAAVSELEAADVVVVDQSGKLLSEGLQNLEFQQSERELLLVRKMENALHDKVAKLLVPWIGRDRFTAEVSAAMDFTRLEETAEAYNPQRTVVRSEERLEEQDVDLLDTVGGVPGTLSNQPPEFGEAAAEEDATEQTRSSRVRSTRNFEVDRTISHTQHASGRVERLTVSVVVDDLPRVDEESGETLYEPWTEENLAALTQAIQTAVGYSEERGDLINVVNKTFIREALPVPEVMPFWAEGWFSDLIKQVLGGIAIIVVVLGLLRPLFKNLSQAGEMVREQQSLAIADLTEMREAAMQEAVPGLPAPIALDPQDSNANKMETVRNLIGEDPTRVAQVVKHWVNEGE